MVAQAAGGGSIVDVVQESHILLKAKPLLEETMYNVEVISLLLPIVAEGRTKEVMETLMISLKGSLQSLCQHQSILLCWILCC